MCLSQKYEDKTLNCVVDNLCLDLKRLEPFFATNRGITGLTIESPIRENLKYSELLVQPWWPLMDNPPHLEFIHLHFPCCICSWSQLSMFMRHFRIVNNQCPEPKTNEEVFKELKEWINEIISPKGLLLNFDSYDTIKHSNDECTGNYRIFDDGTKNEKYTALESTTDNDGSASYDELPAESIRKNTTEGISLPTLSGMETVTCMILNSQITGPYNQTSIIYTWPSAFNQYTWPELSYLEIVVNNLSSLTPSILTLNKTMPKLTYLKLGIPFERISDIMYTFDWESLPFRTGFYAFYDDLDVACWQTQTLDLKAKITSRYLPPICVMYILDAPCQRIEIVDMSQNGLTTLDYIHFDLMPYNFNPSVFKFNLSHNSFQSVSLFSRFDQCKLPFGLETQLILDLSFNELETNSYADFMQFLDMSELYLSHNKYTELPYYKTVNRKYTLSDFKQLEVLDLSYNPLYLHPWPEDGCLFQELCTNDFTPIKKLYLIGNKIMIVPRFVYTVKHLTYIDLSFNRMFEWPIVYFFGMHLLPDRNVHTKINLNFNRIRQVWPNFTLFGEKSIRKVMGNYDICLDDNPLNCSCKAHRIYKYMISSSRSERKNESVKSFPDFSFYETEWKCIFPSQWYEIPLMQIPEYEYDQMCLKNLQNCPDECFCYHSWKLGDVIVTNCTKSGEHVQSELPVELPDSTL